MARVKKTTPIIRYEEGRPVILVEKVPTWDYDMVATIRFWCEYCKKYHIHGAPRREKEHPGHRGAHCINPDSPFKKGGYILEWPEIKEQSSDEPENPNPCPRKKGVA